MRKSGENPQNLGIIQALLQTSNTKFQNIKKETTIYSNWTVVFSNMYITSITGGVKS